MVLFIFFGQNKLQSLTKNQIRTYKKMLFLIPWIVSVSS